MKKLLLIAVAFLIGSVAFAQSNKSPVHYGLKAGVNLSKYNFENYNYFMPGPKTTTTTTNINFNITGFLDAPISSIFSIQPGLSIQGKGGGFSSTPPPTYTPPTGVGYDVMISNRKLLKQNTIWLEVPVNFVLKFPGWGYDFFLGSGPYAAFGMISQNKWDTGNSTSFGFGKFPGTDRKGTDFGVNFIGGIQMNNGSSIGINYGHGLTELRTRPTVGKKINRVLSFSVGHSF